MRMGKEDLHQGGLLYVLIRDLNDSTESAGEPIFRQCVRDFNFVMVFYGKYPERPGMDRSHR